MACWLRCLLVTLVVTRAATADDLQELKIILHRVENKLDHLISVSGTSFHSINDADVTTLFIGAGLPAQDGVVEVLQLTPRFQPDHICRKRSPITFAELVSSPIGIVLNDHILLCGGNIEMKGQSTCRVYNFTSDLWTLKADVKLPEERYRAVTLKRNDGTWWILGGFTNERGLTTKSTLIFNPETYSFSEGPNLPLATADHCVLAINSTHYFMTAVILAFGFEADALAMLISYLGNSDGQPINKAWLFSDIDDKWTELPRTRWLRSSRSLCGYVERRGFVEGEIMREVVVAGGAANSFAYRATEILNLDTLKWRQGPPLPEGSFSGELTMQHGNSFLIFDSEATIFKYLEEHWIPRKEKRLTRHRGLYGSIILKVPNHLC